MRVAIAIVSVLCLVSLFIILLIVRGGGLSWETDTASSDLEVRPEGEENRPGEASKPWPMFHGGPGLTGATDCLLPDALEFYWKFKTGGAVISSAAIDGGRVYVGSDDGNLYALDLASGDEIWRFSAEDSIESSPCVLEGAVFVGSSDGLLYALERETGEIRWKYETGGRILGGVNWARIQGEENARILVGSYDSNLHCVDSQAGTPIWVYKSNHYINGTPAVGNGLAVFGGCDATIHLVSVHDGESTAQIDAGSYIAGSAVFAGKRVYVGHYGEEFLCVDSEQETIVWTYNAEAPFFSTAALGKDRIVVGCQDMRLHCIERETGKKIWTFQTQGDVDSSPVLSMDKVVVGSSDGRLYLIRLSDGKELWDYEIGAPIQASPAVAESRVVIGAEDGYVYAFGPKRE